MTKKIAHQKYFVLVSKQGREFTKLECDGPCHKEFFDTADEAMANLHATVAEDPEHYGDDFTYFKIAAITDEVITVKLSKDFTLEIQ